MLNLEQQIVKWIKDYVLKNHLSCLIIGVSGGIDSAVTSTLCAMTGINTKLVIMPIHQNKEHTERGAKHCNFLKSNFNNIDIVNTDLTDVYETIKIKVPSIFHNKLSLANTRARIRMTFLYSIAGGTNGIVVGTGNKIEDFGVGFFTKYGDGGVDISPIADLMKSEVYDLGKKLNIDKEIIDAPPTDGLWDDDRSDEDQLGVSYDELEWAMNYKNGELDKKKSNIINIYNKHRKQNLHKMKEIPIFKKNKV
tara:strand:+ start:556 stop:1308 length:753 start_codon:yes stop_codon:yes gene_type:complete